MKLSDMIDYLNTLPQDYEVHFLDLLGNELRIITEITKNKHSIGFILIGSSGIFNNRRAK